VLLPCSGSKRPGRGERSSGPSILDDLPRGLAEELAASRAAVRERAGVDEATLLPAWRRYRGTLYKSAHDALKSAIADGRKILILSGGYGVVLATEPIGLYEAVFKASWWPEGLLEKVLAAYATRHQIDTAWAFASATTSYRRVAENTDWNAIDVKASLLLPADVGRGAMVKAPRAQGESLTQLLAGTLTSDWRSSDGVGLEIKPLSSS
jgi:hypothetical protein